MNLREEFKKENGYGVMAVRQDYAGQKPYEDGFCDEYVEWLEEQLLIQRVNQQRELLEWLSNEDYFNIPKDEISEILEDWQTYNSNCG